MVSGREVEPLSPMPAKTLAVPPKVTNSDRRYRTLEQDAPLWAHAQKLPVIETKKKRF